MKFQKFDVLLSKLSNKNILITTHDQVDLDGFASCLILKHFLETFLQRIEIHLFFSKISKYTANFIDNLSIKFPEYKVPIEKDESFSSFNFLIILDTNNLEQVVLPEKISKFGQRIPFIFIDHHLDLKIVDEDNWNDFNLIFDEFTSTAEIIFDICKHYHVEIPPILRYMLVAAIYTDTGGFKYANNETYHHLSKILDDQVSFQEFLLLIEKRSDSSKKIAIIKGLQRIKLIKINNWLIGVSHVSSYTSSLASVMIQVGFDVSIVYSREKSNFRITTRAKKKVCLETNLHLGKILADVENGSGGGHDGAASLNGQDSFEEILNEILEKIKKTLINS